MRKYTPILLLWIFALAIVAEATPTGPRSKETRDLPEFNSISLRVSWNVYLKQGSTQKVEIEGSERSLEEIETRLLTSDVGVEATQTIISSLTDHQYYEGLFRRINYERLLGIS